LTREADGPRAVKRAGLENRYRFYDSRGSFCTALAEKGESALSIMEIAGHRDVRTTRRYVNIADPVKKRAVAKLEKRQGTKGFEKLVKLQPRRSLAQPSSYLGVYAKRGKSVYESKITVFEDGRKRSKYLGTYSTPEEAAKAYDRVARTIPGRKLNFPISAPRRAGRPKVQRMPNPRRAARAP
jgi:hypothetical protein